MNSNYQPAWRMWGSQLLVASLFLCGCIACGAAGSPIAPEDVGLEAKIRKQQGANKLATQPGKETQDPIPLDEEPVQLPPLHPIGER